MATSSLPSTMSGVIIEKTGGTEVLQYKTDLPVPQLKEGQILVKNHSIGINYIDTYFRTGLYPAPSFPYMLGREGAGIVQAVSATGNTYGLKPGDRVGYMAEASYAEYTAVPAARAVPLPDGISERVAAAALLQGLTAWTLIRETHRVEPGDRVLVHAAAGGVGLWLLQMLKHGAGAGTVVATCSTAKIALAKEAGADVVIDYTTTENWPAEVMKATDGEGVIAVFDGVGKSTFDGSMECLARKGTMASFGNASGVVPPVPLTRLTAKNVKLVRPTLVNYIYTREEWEKNCKELFDFMLHDETMDVKIHEVYKLKDVAKAHQDLEGRKSTGKLLLEP